MRADCGERNTLHVFRGLGSLVSPSTLHRRALWGAAWCEKLGLWLTGGLWNRARRYLLPAVNRERGVPVDQHRVWDKSGSQKWRERKWTGDSMSLNFSWRKVSVTRGTFSPLLGRHDTPNMLSLNFKLKLHPSVVGRRFPLYVNVPQCQAKPLFSSATDALSSLPAATQCLIWNDRVCVNLAVRRYDWGTVRGENRVCFLLLLCVKCVCVCPECVPVRALGSGPQTHLKPTDQAKDAV